MLVLRVGVAGPGRGRGELRLAQLPAELLTSWLAAAGGSSELVLHDEKLELLCFLQHNTSNVFCHVLDIFHSPKFISCILVNGEAGSYKISAHYRDSQMGR